MKDLDNNQNIPLYPPLLIRNSKLKCIEVGCTNHVSFAHHCKCIKHAERGTKEWYYHRPNLMKINKNRIIANLGYDILVRYNL